MAAGFSAAMAWNKPSEQFGSEASSLGLDMAGPGSEGGAIRNTEQQPTTLFRSAEATDRSDGKITHLDGLNLSRAWCFHALTSALSVQDARSAAMRAKADHHLGASVPHVAGDYMKSPGWPASRCWHGTRESVSPAVG